NKILALLNVFALVVLEIPKELEFPFLFGQQSLVVNNLCKEISFGPAPNFKSTLLFSHDKIVLLAGVEVETQETLGGILHLQSKKSTAVFLLHCDAKRRICTTDHWPSWFRSWFLRLVTWD